MKKSIFVLAVAVLFLGSCTDNLDEIHLSQNVTDENVESLSSDQEPTSTSGQFAGYIK